MFTKRYNMTCKEERKKIYYRYIDRRNFKNVMTFGGVLVYRNIERVLIRMKLEKYKQRNPKKIGIAIFTIACVLLIAFVFIYSSFASFQTNETRSFINGNVVDPGDLYFAFYVDGVISSTMPAKGEGYTLDKEKTTCTNGATVEWLNDEWAPKILNFTQTRTKCTLYFKEGTFCEQNPETGACTILAQGETEELKFDNTKDNNLRYVGANPNNYVRFNNELWRIIGVFNNIDNGSGTKETRIKLIKATPYNTSMAWNNIRENDWSNANLQKELNGTYLDSIESVSKTMISDAVWNLGGASSYLNTASAFYTYERGTTVYSGHAETWTGKIGLMYASDYGYATSGGSTTNREACLNKELYNWDIYKWSSSSECYNNDWLYNSSVYSHWTLTPKASDSSNVFSVYSSGSVISEYAYTTRGVSPTLYLNSNVKISGGSGTEESPYTLSL